MALFKTPKKRILVVDDEAMVVDLTCEYLAAMGFDTGGAKNTTEAMAEMEKKPADAMLLDIRLPNEDGLEFLKRFKQVYPDIPVIILTGTGYDPEMMQTALRNGASAYVSKDTELENMVAAVKRLLK